MRCAARSAAHSRRADRRSGCSARAVPERKTARERLLDRPGPWAHGLPSRPQATAPVARARGCEPAPAGSGSLSCVVSRTIPSLLAQLLARRAGRRCAAGCARRLPASFWRGAERLAASAWLLAPLADVRAAGAGACTIFRAGLSKSVTQGLQPSPRFVRPAPSDATHSAPVGGSSNGRTPDSDSGCLGSNPSPPATSLSG